MSGFKGAASFAIPLTSTGDVTGSPSLLWKHDQGTPYVPSPTLSGYRLYFTGSNSKDQALAIVAAAGVFPESEAGNPETSSARLISTVTKVFALTSKCRSLDSAQR